MAFFVALTIFVSRRDPALFIERMKASPVQKGQKGWDKVIMSLVFVVAVGYYIIPGFDVIRFEWSLPFPEWLEITAMAVHVPRVVVFYGATYRQWWEQVSGCEFTDKLAEGKKFLYAKADQTQYAIVPHPVSHGVTNKYYQAIGTFLKEHAG